MTYAQVIGIRIRALCKERKLTLNGLAAQFGMRQSTLENIAKGNTQNPTLRTLHRIAVGLNMTVADLLDFPEMNETVFEDE